MARRYNADMFKKQLEFVAVDSAGTEYRVEFFADSFNQQTFTDKNPVVGKKFLQLIDETPVRYISKRKYMIDGIIGPDIELTSDDPNAP